MFFFYSALTLGTHSAFADYNLTVNKNDNRGTWEGWGCSLAWWGKAVGTSSYQSTYADLVFTLNSVSFNGTTLPGLGINIARYNIGGGGLPSDNINGTVESLPSGVPWIKDMEQVLMLPV